MISRNRVFSFRCTTAKAANKKRRIAASAVTALLITLLLVPSGWAGTVCPGFEDSITNGGFAVADVSGKILRSCNGDQPFMPASIFKIPVALAALDILGEDYRFKTDFFMDQARNLYIKGYGDPFLTSEEMRLIVSALQSKGIREIRSLYVDTTAYALAENNPGQGDSDNPYDAPVASLAVNFNTVNFRVSAGGVVGSAEPQTPDLALMSRLGKGKSPGYYRVNIGLDNGGTEYQSSQYAMSLFRAFQQEYGIAGTGAEAQKKVPSDAVLVYSHRNSHDLKGVIASCLRYSNNFIANQLFLACGTSVYGYPATWGKARRAVSDTLDRLIGRQYTADMVLIDGAGLSRHDRMTPEAMIRVLVCFTPYADLLPQHENCLLKTGTMADIFSFAGYLKGGLPVVIILNQQRNTRSVVLRKLAREVLPRK